MAILVMGQTGLIPWFGLSGPFANRPPNSEGFRFNLESILPCQQVNSHQSTDGAAIAKMPNKGGFGPDREADENQNLKRSTRSIVSRAITFKGKSVRLLSAILHGDTSVPR
jgi:hypothetical protein